MPIKYWKHISQKRVWLSLPVITQEAMRHQTEKEHGCLHGFVSEMICSAPLTSLLLWKSGCASLGLESCSSRGVITALFTLGSVCHTGQFFSHWGVWGGLWDKQTASYTVRNKPLIMQGFVILTFFLHWASHNRVPQIILKIFIILVSTSSSLPRSFKKYANTC